MGGSRGVITCGLDYMKVKPIAQRVVAGIVSILILAITDYKG